MSYRLGLYEKAMPAHLSWQEKLTHAQSAGFDFLEMSIDETDDKLSRLDMNIADQEHLHRTMQQTGVYIESMCLSGHRRFPLGSADFATRNRGMEIMKKAIVLSRNLGIRIIQLAGYDVYYEKSTEDTQRFFKENLLESVAFAAQYGIVLAFETMETEFMNTVAKAADWVKTVHSPYLQIYPDTGNMTNAALTYQSNVLDDLIAGKGHIAAVHLKETIPGKFREIPYGTGHVSFHEIASLALSLGVQRFLAEFWYVDGQDWEHELQTAAVFLRQHLD